MAKASAVVSSLSSLKVYALTNFPHFLHPNTALILTDQDDEETYTPALGIRTTYPLQLATNLNSIVEENIVLRLVEQKNKYLHDVEKFTGNYCRSKANKVKIKKEKENVYSIHLNKLMELTVSDPDPYFYGSYNWYYTGGVLETVSISDTDFLFFASGTQLNIFNSATVETTSNGDQLQIQHLDSTNQVACNSIFEIFVSNDNCFVAARQKNQFTIFYLHDENAKQDFQCERNIPFMSGTFINRHFFSIDANRVVQRHDLERNEECGRMYLKLAKNNDFWCQLQAYNNQLIFSDRNKIKIYDSRLFGRKASKCMEINIDSIMEKCDEITCIRSDADENNLYIGTTHNALVFDVRYGMESTNQLTRYTHQLMTPPLMIDASGGGATGIAPNERLVSLSGTFTDDMIIMQHAKIQNDKIRTNNLPRRVLSINDTAEELRRNGLQSEADCLQKRNRTINIGTRFVRKDTKLFLLSQKSSGEIFYQQIQEDDGQNDLDIDDKPFRNIDLEADRLTKDKTFKATTVTNFNSIKRILNYKLPNECDIPDTENPQPNKWQQSFEQLQSYKDMLSTDLLNVWTERISLKNPEKTDRSEFVSGWINKSATERQTDDNVSDNPMD